MDDVIEELAAAEEALENCDAHRSVDGERLVRELLELPAEHLGHRPSAIRRVALALRDPRAKNFCVVHELRDLPIQAVHSIGQEYYSVGYIDSGIECGAVYNVALSELRVPDAARAIPTANPATAPRRPYPHDKEDAEAVDALASALTETVATTLGGARRLAIAPVLVPLCAVVATVCGITTARAGRKHLDASVIAGAVAALVPEEHRTTAERILFADHERHISIDVHELPERFVHDRDRGLALFCRDDEGHVVWNDPTSVNHPRVLRALNHEPL